MAFSNTKARFNICGIFCLLCAVPIVARLFYLQTIRHQELSVKAYKSVNSKVPEIRLRGKILDRNGVVLAESLPTYICAVLKNDTNDKRAVLKALSSSLNVDPDELSKKWQKSKNFFYVKKNIPPDEYQKLQTKITEGDLKGIEITLAYTRYHPGDGLATELLGAVSADENIGLSGLELMYNDILSGKIGQSSALKDRYGNIISEKKQKDSTKVKDVYLTIDSKVQYHAETALKNIIEKTGARGGMAIVQDPKTGDILAAASIGKSEEKPSAFQWTYEPGSTFKVITFSAALETQKIKLSETINCETNGEWQFNPNVTIHDDEPNGTLSVPDVLVHSSNIGSAKIAMRTGLKDFYSYVRAYGFGTKSMISYPGESKGLLRPADKWQPLDLVVTAFGHGISVTGIQLITAYSAIANNGILMEARILDKVADSSGKTISETKPHEIRKVISVKTAQTINEMLRGVVLRGTGKLAQIQGYTVAGKTGTSRKLDESKNYFSKHIASFCGFVPATNPMFTILVTIDEPRGQGYGGAFAAPTFAEIAKRLLLAKAVKPDAPLEASISSKSDVKDILAKNDAKANAEKQRAAKTLKTSGKPAKKDKA